MSPTRSVSVRLDISVTEPTELEMQIAIARLPGLVADESLTVTVNDRPAAPQEIVDQYGSRIHRIAAGLGQVTVDYAAQVHSSAEPAPVDVTDRSYFLRPSRYAECDTLFGFATGQFDVAESDHVLLQQVTDFVRQRLTYQPGWSDGIDGAADTLLAGAGVCRDYAHLVVGLLRALTIPARLVAVYAPGCDPMDFHAVAEALIDDTWLAVDATGLAPRQSLVRISTGRDAADTAFLENHGGAIELDGLQVMATVNGTLPIDDPAAHVHIG